MPTRIPDPAVLNNRGPKSWADQNQRMIFSKTGTMIMKKLLFTSVIFVILFSILTKSAHAQAPAPNGNFNTAYRVQNLDTANNNCYSMVYDNGGT